MTRLGAAFLLATLGYGQTTPADLKYPPLREVHIPDVTTFRLANGTQVYLLENHELPLVRGFALARTGNLFDPKDKVGLAGLTGAVMRSGGTKALTGDQLDVTLENMAASVESSIGETSGSVSFSSLAENTDKVLDLFKQVLTDPAFRQDKLELAKFQTRGGIARRNDDPGGIAGREFARFIYGPATPYGWQIEYATLDSIQRDDLVRFYQRYFFPANIRIAIEGDFATASMRSRLENLFADWTVTQPPVPPFPKVEERPTPGVYLATKDDVTQTFFYLGHLGGLFRDKDYPALQVMGDILGGSFSSRLFVRVRTQLGLAYSVSAGWGANYDHPGIFEISGSTKSASTVDTLAAIRAEVDRIRQGEVTDAELESSKQTVLNSFVFNFDSPVKTLNRLVIYDYYGYPKDFIYQYQKAIQAVTKADVLRVAKQYIKPENLTIVAVGKPADFGKPLSALKLAVKNIDLTIPEPRQAAGRPTAQTQ